VSAFTDCGRPSREAAAGLSLVELLLALAVLACLLALALGAGGAGQARVARLEAQAVLVEAAQRLQQRAQADPGASCTGEPAPELAAWQAPRQGPAAYRVEITGDHACRLTARRQAAGPMAQDRCGDFVLEADGSRALAGAAPGVLAADCWR